jgi:hypothetical protein
VDGTLEPVFQQALHRCDGAVACFGKRPAERAECFAHTGRTHAAIVEIREIVVRGLRDL